MKPPQEIDGAKVLEWAWSGDKPFGIIKYSESDDVAAEIYGLAICQYQDSKAIYRFCCGANWEAEHDSDCASVSEAKNSLPSQYTNVEVNWQKYA